MKFCGFHFKILCLAIGLGIMTISSAQSKKFSLSLDQALSLFYKRNLDLIAAQYNIDQARAQEIIAAAIPNPNFNVDIEQIAPNNNNHLGPFHGFSVTQLIQTAGKRDLKIESSRLGSTAAEEDLQDAVRLLTNSVKKSYFALLLAQKTAEVARENKERYEQLAEVNRLRLQQGDIAESDFLRIDVERLKAESDWNNADAAVQAARSDLAKLLSWPDNALGFLADDAWPDIRALTENTTEERLVEKAISQRPDLAAAKTRIEQAEKQVLLAKRMAVPDVTVGVGYGHDPQNTQDNFATFTMSVPLPVFYQQQGEISQANVNLNNARLDLSQAEQSLRAEVVSSFAKLHAAAQAVERFESQILGKIDHIRDAAELSYNKGATSIIDLIEAERTHKSVLLDYYTALTNRTLIYADLQMAVGDK